MRTKTTTPSIEKTHGELKAQYPDSLLVFRIGDFYETFYTDAAVVSKALGLVLTKSAFGDIPMCGFPYHAGQRNIKELLDAGHKVALCELSAPPKPEWRARNAD